MKMSEAWERIKQIVKMVRKLHLKDKVKVLSLLSQEVKK